MKDCFMAILAIVGTVIGSGFISGKEIMVFFSRFGWYSFLFIALAFVLFFVLFKLLLNCGEKALNKLEKSKFSFLINLFLCLFFSSAMFAGIANLLQFDNIFANLAVFFFVLLLSYLVFKHGLGGLNKINMVIVPIMILIFVGFLASKISFKTVEFEGFAAGGAGLVYAILYVILNTANGGVIIANYGKKLSKRQKTQVAFLSALTLFVILLIANLVLLLNPTSFVYAMPLVSIFSGVGHIVMTIVVFMGCLTTLLTLVYTLSTSMRGLCKNEILIFFVSVIVPLLLSLVGFDFIVEHLYPLASVLGIYLLCDLLFANRKGKFVSFKLLKRR
ncbi:MAG: hypothetical protein HFI85_05605 [Clostridia bacterium]|nr:hypothetical protein [Clostridia bacterium]